MSRTEPIAVITFNQVPARNPTFKYLRLGPLALENRRIYCDQHGYRFISTVPIASDRPACWAKIPAILEAFQNHRWVLWADSDALVLEYTGRLEKFCDEKYDLIVASPEEFFRFLGIPFAQGLARMPINTGVFLIRASAWSEHFLRLAYAQTQFVSTGEIWNGIGEQEAMTAILHQNPDFLSRIKHVTHLQNHPKFYRPGDLFVHFYGNYARHHIPISECEEVFRRWGLAIRQASGFPPDVMRFHWCCIQNLEMDAPVVRGDLSHYLYEAADLEASSAAVV